jgi:hypothetical protein
LKTPTTKEVLNSINKKVPYREAHLQLIDKLEQHGIKIFGGQHFPLNGATLFFQADRSEVEDFVKNVTFIFNLGSFGPEWTGKVS